MAAIGDEIYILGFPETGLFTLNLTKGVLSGFVENYIKTDAKMSAGSSGSPVLNSNNEVIGIGIGSTSDNFEGLG